jgi:Kinesin-associated protein (KAP)
VVVVVQENKDLMAECSIVKLLIKYVPVRNEVLLMAVLRLLHNLSFDRALREDMVKQVSSRDEAGVALSLLQLGG